MKAKALRETVLVTDIQKGERMVGRIIIPNDDGKSSGVRERWAKVYAVGEGVRDINEGDWLLLKHGNWTRGMDLVDDNGEPFTIWKVNYPDGCLAVADSPTETFHGEGIVKAEQLKRD